MLANADDEGQNKRDVGFEEKSWNAASNFLNFINNHKAQYGVSSNLIFVWHDQLKCYF